MTCMCACKYVVFYFILYLSRCVCVFVCAGVCGECVCVGGVLFLFIYCLSLLPLFVGGSVLGLCFVIYSISCHSRFCNHLDGEKRANCCTLSVFLMSCDSQYSVALPHGAVGWSVVCDCGIS